MNGLASGLRVARQRRRPRRPPVLSQLATWCSTSLRNRSADRTSISASTRRAALPGCQSARRTSCSAPAADHRPLAPAAVQVAPGKPTAPHQRSRGPLGAFESFQPFEGMQSTAAGPKRVLRFSAAGATIRDLKMAVPVGPQVQHIDGARLDGHAARRPHHHGRREPDGHPLRCRGDFSCFPSSASIAPPAPFRSGSSARTRRHRPCRTGGWAAHRPRDPRIRNGTLKRALRDWFPRWTCTRKPIGLP